MINNSVITLGWFLKIILSIYFWLCWVFIDAQGFLSVVQRLLIVVVSLVVDHRLWGAQALLVAGRGL